MKGVKCGICIITLHMFYLIALFLSPMEAYATIIATESVYLPESLKPQLSEDQTIIYKAQPVKVFIADLNPPTGRKYIPPPAWISAIPEAARTAAFQITYVADDDQDLWGAECRSFPPAAKASLSAAANIWANLLHSSTPITIRACWGDLGPYSQTLGYSGGGSYLRDFSGATRANTWYVSSLANALNGRDILSSEYDMHITFNGNLPGVYHWNYSTGGTVDSDEYDFISVALHEICHGLGFAGSMNGTSNWGIEGYPLIYDVFTRDTFGTRLIDYDEYYPHTLLGALTSGRVYFHGPRAKAANGGKRVELFTPDYWMPGSSYSHLDMDFNQTPNELMVYMLSRAEAIHNPGPVSLGLLKDLGWPESAVDSPGTPGPPGPPSPPNPPSPPSPSPVDKQYLPYMFLLLGEDRR